MAPTETQWDQSHDWRAEIDGCRLFRRDRQERKGGVVALYIKRRIECEELSLTKSHEQVESLWVRSRDQGDKGNLAVDIYCGRLLMRLFASNYRRQNNNQNEAM